MFKNPHLRLLMKLVGMQRLAPSLDETPDSSWIIPGDVTADALRDNLDHISKAEFSPPVFEDGGLAEDQLRRKSAARKRVSYDDDDDMQDLIDEGEPLFPLGKLAARKPDHERPKKGVRRRQRRGSNEEEPTEEQLDEKARARRQKELERARKVKSEMYVHASDDETDDERDRSFFENERRRQDIKNTSFGLSKAPTLDTGKSAWERLVDGDSEDDQLVSTQKDVETPGASRASRKRKTGITLQSTDDEEEPSAIRQSKKKKKPRNRVDESSDDDLEASSQSLDAAEKHDEAMDTDDTPLSSSPRAGEKSNTAEVAPEAVAGATQNEDDDDEDMPMAAPVKARRVRAGFILDSSDEE